jgi:hypothetical protein
MALSYVEYTGNASTISFGFSGIDRLEDIPNKDQMDVYVNGQLKVYTTDYTIDGTDVDFNTAPAAGARIKIARNTDIDDRIVTFANSSILTAADLNKNTDQLLFLAQELDDAINDLVIQTASNVADGAITSAKLRQVAGDEAVVTTAIQDGAVQAAKLASDSVTTVKILAANVTPAKLSAGAPTWEDDGDTTILKDLGVTANLSVTGTSTFTGAATFANNVTFSNSLAYPALTASTITTSASYSTPSPHARTDAIELTALTTSITTKRANSKVLVRFVVSYEPSAQHGAFILFRDSTEIGSNTDATPSSRNYGIAPVRTSGNNTNFLGQTVIEYVDTPPAAGTYSYKLKAYYRASALTIHLNKTSADADNNAAERASSSVILQEIFQP